MKTLEKLEEEYEEFSIITKDVNNLEGLRKFIDIKMDDIEEFIEEFKVELERKQNGQQTPHQFQKRRSSNG